MNTMFEHKGVYMCTWHQETLGRRSMIDFVVMSSVLEPRVSDTRVKRGMEMEVEDIKSKWTIFSSIVNVPASAVIERSPVPVIVVTPELGCERQAVEGVLLSNVGL